MGYIGDIAEGWVVEKVFGEHCRQWLGGFYTSNGIEVSLLSAIQPVAINELASFSHLERRLPTHDTPPNNMRRHDKCSFVQTQKQEPEDVRLKSPWQVATSYLY